MEFIIKNTSISHPKTYYHLTFFSLKWINTYQVWSINLVILNILFKVLNEKKENIKDNFFKVTPAKTVEEAEEWCKRQLERKCNK